MQNKSFQEYAKCLKFFECACLEVQPLYNTKSDATNPCVVIGKIFLEKSAVKRKEIFGRFFKSICPDEATLCEGKVIEAQTALKNAIVCWLGDHAYENGSEKGFLDLVELVGNMIGKAYPTLNTNDLLCGLRHDRRLRNAIEHHRNKDIVIRQTDDERFQDFLGSCDHRAGCPFEKYTLSLDDLQNLLIRHLSFISLMFLSSSERGGTQEHEAVKTAYMHILDNEVTDAYYFDSARRHIPFLHPSRKFDYTGRLASEIIANDFRINGLDSRVKVERANY